MSCYVAAIYVHRLEGPRKAVHLRLELVAKSSSISGTPIQIAVSKVRMCLIVGRQASVSADSSGCYEVSR